MIISSSIAKLHLGQTPLVLLFIALLYESVATRDANLSPNTVRASAEERYSLTQEETRAMLMQGDQSKVDYLVQSSVHEELPTTGYDTSLVSNADHGKTVNPPPPRARGRPYGAKGKVPYGGAPTKPKYGKNKSPGHRLCAGQTHEQPGTGFKVTYEYLSAHCDNPFSSRIYTVWCQQVVHVERLIYGHIIGYTLVRKDAHTFKGICPPRTYCRDDLLFISLRKRNTVQCDKQEVPLPGEPNSLAIDPNTWEFTDVCTDDKYIPFPREADPADRAGQLPPKVFKTFRVWEETTNARYQAKTVAKLWMEDRSSRFQFPRAEEVNANVTGLDLRVTGPEKHLFRFCMRVPPGRKGDWVVLHYGSVEEGTEY